MPNLDIRTLSFLALISSLILAAGLQLINSVIVKEPSVRLWAWGATASGAAYLLLAVRGAGFSPLSVVLVNALMISGAVCMYLGNQRFRNAKDSFPWYWILAAATVALIYWFSYQVPSLPARNLTISAAFAAVFFPCAFVMLRTGDRRDRRERWFVAAAYLIMAVFMAARALATPFMPSPEQDFMFMTNNFHKFSFVVGFTVNVALSMGLPLLVSGRLQLRLSNSFAEREADSRRRITAFGHALGSLALAVERRDSYCANHQPRVAELAAAIGRALGLDVARIEGLVFAATIHDIGLISVPLDILIRPAKLSPMEFELIKSHAPAGAEIVQDVEFPWPVADMIRQHHERLDGSGYPLGLKGDQILLESRILAVADMVEAMCSDRRHRLAPGLDAALAQIGKEAGSKLDSRVAEACERVFHAQGFAFGRA